MKKLKCILLVDDDVPTNFYNRKVIEQVGGAEKVEVCTSGKAALEFLKARISSDPNSFPELIFLDLNMPGMNGLEFLDEYHRMVAELSRSIVVVMLTTSLNPDDETKALSKGVQGFARKPLTKDYLTTTVQDFFNTED